MTKADKARFLAFQEIGCVACAQDYRFALADAHHLLSGGRRKGHQYTIPLCPWHHRGVPPEGFAIGGAELILGPSLALSPKRFRDEYGDDDLLLTFTNERIAAYEATR